MERLTSFFVWLRMRSFFRVTQRTLVSLMPLALISAVFQFLASSFFSSDSLLFNLVNLEAYLPKWLTIGAWNVANGVTTLINGFFGVFVAYLSAQYTARLYRKNTQMAGTTGVMALLLISYRYFPRDQVRMTTTHPLVLLNWRLINLDSILFAFIVGYAVGQLFHWLGQTTPHDHTVRLQVVQDRSFMAFKPIIVALSLALLIGLVGDWFGSRSFLASFYNAIQSSGFSNHEFLWTVLILAFVLTIGWSGMIYPLTILQSANSNGTAVANMNAAFLHGSSWKVPYPLFGPSLLNTYASVALPLVLMLLFTVKKEETFKVSKLSLLPVLFNSNLGLILGVPIILNPVYMIPFIGIPIVNVLLAAGAITLKLIPASAYPVLLGTPSILKAFVATNGYWGTLIFALLLLVLDSVLFLPFIRLSQKVEQHLAEDGREEALK